MQMQDRAVSKDSAKADSQIQFSRPVPPTLLRIYADNQDKRSLCIFWIIFFVILILVTGISFGLPAQVLYYTNEIQLKQTTLKDCDRPAQFSDSKQLICYDDIDRQGVMLTNLVKEHQFAVIFLNFMLVDGDKEFEEVQYKTKISLHQLKQEGTKPNIRFKQIQNITAKNWYDQTLYPIDAIAIYGEDQETIIGYRYPLYALREFHQQSFVLFIDNQPPLLNLTSNIDQIVPEIMVVNPKFTAFSIAIRYVFFVLSLVAAVVYGARFKKIRKQDKILEQKMIMVLSVLLIMFNDPLYPVTVLYPNKASSYFSVFFVINFIIYLLMLWIIFLDRIYYEDGEKTTKLFTPKRIAYIVITYILVLVLYTEIALDHIAGLPVVPTQDIHTRKFVALEILVLICIVAGFVYLLFRYITICTKVDEKMWRNQLFMFFSIFFLFVVLVMFFINGFSINDMAGNRILLLFTVMNMYTFYLQYMYSITNEQRDNIDKEQMFGNGNKGGGFGLLENGSDGADCVDLQFKDMIPPQGLHFKKDKEDENEKKGWGYQFDMKQMQKEQLQEIESDKQTDFFKERDDENERKDKKKEQKDFDEFSLE